MCGISFKVSRSDINQTKNYYSTYENHLKGCYNNYTAFVINKTKENGTEISKYILS